METYDIIMLVVLGVAALWGYSKGFAWQVASIASLSVSYWVALKFRDPFSQQIKAEPPWNKFLAMFLLFVGTMLAIWIVFRMISNTIDKLKLRDFDRTLGALLGLAKGGILCILITMFAVTLLGDAWKSKIVHSKSGYYIAKFLDYSKTVIPPEFHEVVGPHLQRLEEEFRNAPPPSDLPAPATDQNPGLPTPWSASAATSASPKSPAQASGSGLSTFRSSELPAAPFRQAQTPPQFRSFPR